MKYLLLIPMLLICFWNVSTIQAQSITRGPYLQMLGSQSITVKWRTNTNTNSKVWFGTAPNSLNQSTATSPLTTEHEISLSGLSSNTVYYYAVGTSSDQLIGGDENHYFRTSPEGATSETTNIWVLGDAGTRSSSQRNVRDAFYNYHGNNPLDMALLLGDNAYSDGTDEEYQDAWFEDMYEDRLINMPLFSAYGNHDGYSANSSSESGPYFDIFNFPKNGELGGEPSGHEGFYSFNHGDIHIISINDYDEDMSLGGEQYQWLEADLEANDKSWLIVICHYAPHDGRNNHSNNSEESTAIRENYMPLLEEHGVDLVLAGHSHSYQRSYLIADYFGQTNEFDETIHGVNMGDGQLDGDGAYLKGEDNEGTIYMITGTAGTRASLSDDLSHPAMYSNHMLLGSVRLQITYNQLDASFVTDEGIIEDYFTIIKDLSNIGSEKFTITNPLREGYPEPQPIIVTYDFTDTSDLIQQIEYYANGLLESTETVYPYFMNYNIPADGTYEIMAKATTVGGEEYTDQVSFEVGAKECCKSVSSSNNDAEERGNGSISISSSDLELSLDGTNQQIGLRYIGLGIPKGANIQNANIQFTTDKTNNTDPSNLTIHGEAADNASAFSNAEFSISSRAKTSAAVNWSPPIWSVVGESGPNQKTPGLNNIVQQIVNRSGYTDASSIAFIVSGTGRRTASSYDGAASEAAVLCVEYTPDYPVDSDGDGTNDSEDLCPGGLELGALCNDFNSETYNDTIGPDCNCVGVSYDCALLQVDFNTPCDDENSATYDDVVDENCNCIGTPFDCPIFLADVGTPCDDNNTNTLNDVVDVNCNCTGTSYTIQTVFVPVSSNNDDAEQRPEGNISLNSSDLELMTDGDEIQKVGIRFQNPGIPNGASIVEAYVQFTSDKSKNLNPCVIQIYGEANVDSPIFEKINYNISDRSKTNSVVFWTPDGPWFKDETTDKQKTADLTEVIQEVINQPGYNYNNPITLLLEGNGIRVAKSFDGSPTEAAVLVVKYGYSCEDSDNDGLCNDFDDCPESPQNPGEPCDDGDPLTFGDVIDDNCNCVGSVPSGEACAKIATDDDDAEERASGEVKLGSSDLEMIIDNSTQTIGLRFINMNIPPGVTISDAHLQFTVDETENINPCVLTIQGEASDDSAPFTEAAFGISNRTKTTEGLNWSPQNWTSIGDSGTAQQSVNIAAVLQEIIDRPGYTANSAIGILISGTGKRVAMSHDKNPESAPELCVNYELEVPPAVGEVNEYNNEQAVDKSDFSDLNIYPNPARDFLRLVFEPLGVEEIIELKIVDVNGKVLLYNTLLLSEGEGQLMLNDLELANGVYFIQLKTKGSLRVGEFVIVK